MRPLIEVFGSTIVQECVQSDLLFTKRAVLGLHLLELNAAFATRRPRETSECFVRRRALRAGIAESLGKTTLLEHRKRSKEMRWLRAILIPESAYDDC